MPFCFRLSSAKCERIGGFSNINVNSRLHVFGIEIYTTSFHRFGRNAYSINSREDLKA